MSADWRAFLFTLALVLVFSLLLGLFVLHAPLLKMLAVLAVIAVFFLLFARPKKQADPA